MDRLVRPRHSQRCFLIPLSAGGRSRARAREGRHAPPSCSYTYLAPTCTYLPSYLRAKLRRRPRPSRAKCSELAGSGTAAPLPQGNKTKRQRMGFGLRSAVSILKGSEGERDRDSKVATRRLMEHTLEEGNGNDPMYGRCRNNFDLIESESNLCPSSSY